MLYLQSHIHKTTIKHILVDGGSRLNLCILSLIKKLTYFDNDFDHQTKDTIKSYAKVEHESKGSIKLPIQVKPTTIETTCQILDLDLPYNILLGRLWIHAMQFIPSTFHQCVKFPQWNLSDYPFRFKSILVLQILTKKLWSFTIFPY